MGFLLLMALFVLLWIAFGRLSKFFYKMSYEVQQKEAQEKYFKNELLRATQGIEVAVTPVKEERNPIEGLLRANQEIVEKQRLNAAIEDELGICMKNQK